MIQPHGITIRAIHSTHCELVPTRMLTSPAVTEPTDLLNSALACQSHLPKSSSSWKIYQQTACRSTARQDQHRAAGCPPLQAHNSPARVLGTRHQTRGVTIWKSIRTKTAHHAARSKGPTATACHCHTGSVSLSMARVARASDFLPNKARCSPTAPTACLLQPMDCCLGWSRQLQSRLQKKTKSKQTAISLTSYFSTCINMW